jgi:hypothetical protein
MTVNAQYNVAAAGSLPVRIQGRKRREMYERFLAAARIEPQHSIIDIGATSDRTYDHSNYFVAWYPWKTRVTAVGVDDASFLETAYPGVKFFKADGKRLPFADGSFDYAHSSAVLEHVGSRDEQVRFLREMWRVSRKGIFATTPNRWFPIEFHTVLPLLHWLPPALFRRALRSIGRGFFAEESNLNLLTGRELAEIARAAEIPQFRIESVALLGWPSNLLLIAERARDSLH